MQGDPVESVAAPSGALFVLGDQSQTSITISVAKGAVLILKPDGRLERGEAFAADDAVSVEIFDILSRAMPSWMSGLRERAERAESRADAAEKALAIARAAKP